MQHRFILLFERPSLTNIGRLNRISSVVITSCIYCIQITSALAVMLQLIARIQVQVRFEHFFLDKLGIVHLLLLLVVW